MPSHSGATRPVASHAFIVGVLGAALMFLLPTFQRSALPEDSPAAKPQDAKDRFFAEYPKAFEKLSSPFRNIIVRGRLKEEHADIPEDAQTKPPFDNDHAPWEAVGKFAKTKCDADFTYYIADDSVEFELRYAAETQDNFHPETKVLCTTPSYYFTLEKPAGQKEYAIVQHTSEKKFVEKVHVITNTVAKYNAEAAFEMYGTVGSLLLSEKDCKIDSAQYVQEADKKLIVVEFTGLSEKFWYKRGRAVFDPNRIWAITEFELHEDFTKPYGRSMYCKIDYGDWNSVGLVFPKKVDRRMVYTTEGHATQLRLEVAQFTAAEPDAVPKGQFALSAYGLPEIAFENPSSSADSSEPSGLVLVEATKDLGPIPPSDPITVRFQFRNETAKPIRILGAEQTCADGCNEIPALPVEIAPNAAAEIEVSYTPTARPGDFNKQFTVFTNDPGRPNIELSITGTVQTPAPSDSEKK